MGSLKKKPFLRLMLLRLVLLAVFALLSSRLWYLQIVEGARFRQAAEGNRRRTLPTAPVRGRIYDRSGFVLAENVPSFTVLAMVQDLPEEGRERTYLFDRLCHLLQCRGNLQVDPAALGQGARQSLYSWLAAQMEPPRQEAQEFLATAVQPFTLTLQLDETGASWLRGQIEASAGLTYTNSLEDALQRNTGPPYLPVPLMDNVPRDRALVLDEHHLDFPGVFVQAEPIRRYPTGMVTAHIVGHMGRISAEELAEANPDPRSGQPVLYLENDRIGKTGAEKAYESLLRGRLGVKEIQVDAGGRPVGVPFWTREAVNGYDVVLTLDTQLQERVTEILQQYIWQAEEERAGYYGPVYAGVAIVMDVRNGQILAMVSLPSYDNGAFARGITVEEFGALLDDSRHPLVNRAIGGAYPPGSTFKLVVAGAGLQEKVITPESKIQDKGALLVPNRYDPSLPPQVFPCWLRSGHGWQDIVVGIRNSCNVFFFTVAGGTPEKNYEDGLGAERLIQYAHAYGYGEMSGIGFPGEVAGLMPGPEWKEETLGEPWVQGDVYNMAIGQGNILATPLQVLNTAAATANGGTLYRPQLLLRVVDQQGRTIQDFAPQVIRRLPTAPEYLALVREGMRRVVTEGAADYARKHSSVAIAGKTGSAEYGPFLKPGVRQAHAWFVGFAPYEDPQVAVVVMVEGGGQGSRVAMPAVTDIIEYYFTRPAGTGK